jgi:hypothetical protein
MVSTIPVIFDLDETVRVPGLSLEYGRWEKAACMEAFIFLSSLTLFLLAIAAAR